MTRMRLTIVILLSAGMLLGSGATALTEPDTLSTADKQALLDRFNEWRSQTAAGDTEGQPGAGNMERLLWDHALAAVATNYAAQCTWAHNANRSSDFVALADQGRIDTSPGAYYVGENLYVSSVSPPTIEQLLEWSNGWFDEYLHYTFGTVNVTEGCTGTCGHYTQAVWATTRYVGCGFHICPTITNLS